MTDDKTLSGERYDGAANLARLDGDYKPRPGTEIRVRRHAGDDEPLRMVLVTSAPGLLGITGKQPGEKDDGPLTGGNRPVWFVRPWRRPAR